MMKFLLALLAMLLFLPSVVSAETYYVCDNGADCNSGSSSGWSTGNDSNDGKSMSAAWKNPEYAMSSASGVGPGDTVIVGDGEYFDHDSDGSVVFIRAIGGSAAGGYITLKAENDYQAKFNGLTGTAAVSAWYDTKYIKIEGFDLTGGGHVVVLFDNNNDLSDATEHMWIYNNKIHDNADKWYYSSCLAMSFGDEYALIERNEFYHCGPGPIGYNSDSRCPPPLGNCDSQVRDDCSVSQCEKSLGYSIYLKGVGHVIRNNIFRDPSSHAGPFIKVDNHLIGDDGISPHLTIVNNVFSGHPSDGNVDGWQIWAIPSHSHGLPDARAQTDVICANNAFHDPGFSSSHINGGWGCNAAVCFNTGSLSENWRLYNNRAESELFGAYVKGSPDIANPILSGNLDQSDGWTVSDFGFIDAASDNYALRNSSLMIDQARSDVSPQEDFDGNPRGSQPDIGAYEYPGSPLTCSSQGFSCCDSCQPVTEQPAYDSDCPGQFCCGACYQQPGSAIRVNCGGGDYTDVNGSLWSADYGYNSGMTVVRTLDISGTQDDVIFQSERYDPPGDPLLYYSFQVPNGDYTVNLLFAETRDMTPGERVFDTWVEGSLVLDNLDIHSEAGDYAALVKTVETPVHDNEINISFTREVQSPKVCGIEIIGKKETVFSSVDSYLGDSLNWEPLNSSRWGVVDDSGDLAYGITDADFSRLSGSRLGEYSLIKDRTYQDFIFKSMVRTTEDLASEGAADYDIVFGFQDPDNYFYLMFNSNPIYGGLNIVADGSAEMISTERLNFPDNGYHEVILKKIGENVTAYLDGGLVLDVTNSSFTPGLVGVGGLNDASLWDDITVRELHDCDTSPRDGCVEEHELIAYIALWYLDSTTYPMGELMEAVGLWNNPGPGC